MALHFSAQELDNIQKMNHAGGWGSKALGSPWEDPRGGGGREVPTYPTTLPSSTAVDGCPLPTAEEV